jgi:hypothetical protein
MYRKLILSITLILSIPIYSWAAPALLQVEKHSTQPNHQVSDAETLTFEEGSLVIVWAGLSNIGTNITVSSPTMNFQEDIDTGHYDINLEIWSAANVSAGSHTVTVTCSESSFIRWGVAEFSGVATSNQLIDISDQDGSTSDTSIHGGSVTTAQDDTLLVCAVRTDGDEGAHGNINDVSPFVEFYPFTNAEPEQKLMGAWTVVDAGTHTGNCLIMDNRDGGGFIAAKAAYAPLDAPPTSSIYSPTSSIYWVDNNGTQTTWASCNQDEQMSGTSACSLATANSNADEGQTVYLRAGDYTSVGINPTNSGTVDERITFVGYNGETVTIKDQSSNMGILLDGDSYITVQDINFENMYRMLYMRNSANYNIIDNCTFTNSYDDSEWYGSRIYNDSNYNWIKNSTFSKIGECSGGSDTGNVFEIGDDDAANTANYNLIEDSIFYHGGHHVVGIHGRYNVFRNNYIHNEVWTNGKGNRNLYLLGHGSYAGYNLIENNRMGYAAPPCDAAYVTQFLLASRYNKIRHNSMYHGNAEGIAMTYYSNVSSTSHGSYNAIYNNTFFNNDYQTAATGDRATQIAFLNSAVTGNLVKNNLYYSHDYIYGFEPDSVENNQTFANEWGNDSDTVDPLFVNASTTPPEDKTDSTLPNLNLQPNSPAINAGGALTTVAAADSGSGTSLIVDNASYFQDGTWGPPGTNRAVRCKVRRN